MKALKVIAVDVRYFGDSLIDFKRGIQKIAKINSQSVKKRFRVGVELKIFSWRN